jgi:hypothetical protein
LRYQHYIIGQEVPGDITGWQFRRFTAPVHNVEGMWVPSSPPSEETHLWDQVELALQIDDFIVHTDNTAGKLDDLPCPDGWRVLARDWLPDDYVPPAKEELDAKTEAAIEHLKKLGVWRDPS